MKFRPGRIVLSCLAIISLLHATGCTRTGAFIAAVPGFFDDVTRHADIQFDAANKLSLDVYTPNEPTKTLKPVVVFFYGGNWRTGDKNLYKFVGDRLAAMGHVVVIADYRKYPFVRFPEFMNDAASAVKWVTQNGQTFGGDPNRIILVGHSAGAHIGAMLATDRQFLTSVGVDPGVIKGFAGLAGPYAFVPDTAELVEVFGRGPDYASMQVPTFITGREPPMLLLYGLNDSVVHITNLEKLRDAVLARQGQVDVRLYKNVDHVRIVTALTWVYKRSAPVIDDLRQFFERVS